MRAAPGGEKPRSEINVTPLVDVCLVLLIIFMVVAPMLDRHAEVKVPEARNPARLEDGPARIVLAMHSDGTTWYRQSWLPPREMLGKLRELHEREGGKEIVLLADTRLSFADVRRTMRIVQEAGFSGVNLAAKRETKNPFAAP
jgi:biopolymer transport protein TolR